MQYAWLYPIASAFAVALFAYLGIIRKASGRIARTEADELWAEARNLREVYRAELGRLRSRIEELEAEVETHEETIAECRSNFRRLQGENAELRRRVGKVENAP
jgi:chromosome segregation ATPase